MRFWRFFSLRPFKISYCQYTLPLGILLCPSEKSILSLSSQYSVPSLGFFQAIFFLLCHVLYTLHQKSLWCAHICHLWEPKPHEAFQVWPHKCQIEEEYNFPRSFLLSAFLMSVTSPDSCSNALLTYI